ncbi:prefoldin subunit beta [Candidatus Pacearchaeota archaeon]|nr:prefoldin subunit beta [Candidatus Pacearchaeota archaeon]
MNIDKETQEKIKELQLYEQNLNNLMMQKQAFQVELNETENALTEINKSKDEIFKLIGNIMVKSDKEKIEKELKKRRDMIDLRLRSIEKQEETVQKQLDELKKDVLNKIK